MKHVLKAHGLILLSGPSGSGKSHVARKLRALIPGMANPIVSTDELRKAIVGERNYGDIGEIIESCNDGVFDIARTWVVQRMREHLTTVVDATLLTEADRGEFAKIALAYGRPVTVLIMGTSDTDVYRNNKQRRYQVPESVITGQVNRFQRVSRYPHLVVDSDDEFEIELQQIPGDTGVDVLGDTHGLYPDVLKLLAQLGYGMSQVKGAAMLLPQHPEGRKLVFVGDFVDRGQFSVEMLRFVRECVTRLGHYAVCGNHEYKLVKLWTALREGTEPIPHSPANGETLAAVLRLPFEEQQALIAFLRSLPGYLLYRDMAFMHGTVGWFSPLETPFTDLLYGISRLPGGPQTDTDAQYQALYAAGVNKYRLVRGHQKSFSVQSDVISLEHEAEFAGELAALRADTPWRGDSATLVTQKVYFDFGKHAAQKFELARALEKLAVDKLVHKKKDAFGLVVYKYASRVLFENLWHLNPVLAKARGLVLDQGGNIVQHPFDRCPNYGETEESMQLANDRRVIAVDKLNGFLVSVTRHPYKNELLVTTSGSFESPFVEMAKRLIYRNLYAALMRFLHREDITLMFEALDPADPHIIPYGSEHHGLWLIGARRKHASAVCLPEADVDSIAQEIGVRRPVWRYTTISTLREEVRSIQHEGFMVRDPDTGAHLVKWKSPHYLTRKLLARLSEGKVKLMFRKPDIFKRNQSELGGFEELFPLVDRLTTSLSEEAFLSMSDQERLACMLELA